MSSEIKAALVKYMDNWIAAHDENESFDWSQYWYDDNLAERMGEAAFAVFMAAREAQDFAKARDKEQ